MEDREGKRSEGDEQTRKQAGRASFGAPPEEKERERSDESEDNEQSADQIRVAQQRQQADATLVRRGLCGREGDQPVVLGLVRLDGDGHRSHLQDDEAVSRRVTTKVLPGRPPDGFVAEFPRDNELLGGVRGGASPS